jgi:hypothetical protein
VFQKENSRQGESAKERRNEDDNQRRYSRTLAEVKRERSSGSGTSRHSHSRHSSLTFCICCFLLFYSSRRLVIILFGQRPLLFRSRPIPCGDLPSSQTSSHGARGWHRACMHGVAAYYTAAAALTGFFLFELNMRAFLLVRCHCRQRCKGVFSFRAQNGREGATGMGTQGRFHSREI